jgi:hypothetical protein
MQGYGRVNFDGNAGLIPERAVWFLPREEGRSSSVFTHIESKRSKGEERFFLDGKARRAGLDRVYPL